MPDVSPHAPRQDRRQQIGPRLTPATKELLDQACATRMLSVSELVEHALLAYLASPAEADGVQGIAQTLATLQARVDDMHTALGMVMTLLTPKAPEQEPERPKIATYEEMYGPIEAPPAASPVPEPVAPGRGLRRWLTRETS